MTKCLYMDEGDPLHPARLYPIIKNCQTCFWSTVYGAMETDHDVTA